MGEASLPEGPSLLAALRYALFALLAVVGPGVAAQRLLRVRADPALVLPLGLAGCAGAYFLALRLDAPWLFAALLLALDATLLLGRPRWAEGPSLRGALPALLAVVACFSLSVYRQDALDAEGAFLAGGAQPDDAAFHVGLAFELALGYPPQAPGLSGFPLDYHVGVGLVRAAALRFAGIHPYDALARLDNTLFAAALVLALRGAARALGGSPLAVALAGFSPLASDLSFLAAPGRGIEWWVGVFEGGTGLQSLFHANSLVPALALALAALIALRRHLAGEGAGWLALGALASLACPLFKVFLGAQYLGALGVAVVLAPRRGPLAALAAAAAAGLLPLALGRGAETMEVLLDPLAVVQDARADLGLGSASALALALFVPAWLLASLGLRVAGLAGAARGLAGGDPVAAALAAFALSGWPLGLLLRISPLEAGGRERPFNEALYFFESSGFALWLFAALAVGAAAGRMPRAARLAACALLTLPSTVQFVLRERAVEPRRVPAPAVRAALALLRVTRPGDVVLVRPERQRYPPPPLLVGRRVPFTRFIPFYPQLASRESLLRRYARTAEFFATADAALAGVIAGELQARAVCLLGAEELRFATEPLLEQVHAEPGARTYRIIPAPPPPR